MTWLERVRQKNSLPHGRGTDKTAKREETTHNKLAPYESGTAKTDKSQNGEAFVSFGTSGVEGREVFAEPIEAIIVAYQRFSLDYDLPDGAYTPKELRKAKVLVKPGPVLRYRLRWPGGITQPMTQHGAMTSRPHHAQSKGSG
jgi:hypothetical protein